MIDYTKLGPIELRVLAYGLTVLIKFNDNILFAVNEKGESFAVYNLPEPPEGYVKPRFAPKCAGICNNKLRRWHLTCLVCRYRKIKNGKLPLVVPITIYMLAMGHNRRFERFQRFLVKKELAIVETTALAFEGKNKK